MASEQMFCQTCNELLRVPSCALFCPMCGRAFRDDIGLTQAQAILDLHAICRELGLFDGARPVSPATVVATDVLPTIRAMRRGKIHDAVVSHLRSQSDLIEQLLRRGSGGTDGE